MSFRTNCLFLLCWTSISATSLKFEDWHCGHTTVTRQQLYTVAKAECSPVIYDWNHCCAIHDECYVRQLGQLACDEAFCQCTGRPLLNKNLTSCSTYQQIACFLMPSLGEESYLNSVNYTEPKNLTKHLPKGIPSIAYAQLYSQCPRNNLTLSSCALIHNECSTDTCRQKLCSCIQAVAEMDGGVECINQMNATCQLLLRPWTAVDTIFETFGMEVSILAKLDIFPWFWRNLYVIIAIFLICIATISLIIQIWTPRKIAQKKNDYSTLNI